MAPQDVGPLIELFLKVEVDCITSYACPESGKNNIIYC